MDRSDPKLSIGKALGRVPSGVYILTARNGQRAGAMLASWVMQAAFEPPAISVAVAKGRPIIDLIRSSRRLAISIIAENDKSLMKRYARGVKDGEDPFAGVEISASPANVPILTDALAWLEGELIAACDFDADHDLLIARITAGSLLRDGPAFNHQRGNGFHY